MEKKNTLLRRIKTAALCVVSASLLLVAGTLKTSAQTSGDTSGSIDWLKYATTVDGITSGGDYYLFNIANTGYVNAGSTYGMVGVLDKDNMGIRLKVTNNNGTYTFESYIKNTGQGSYLGYEPYYQCYTLDRGTAVSFKLDTTGDAEGKKFVMSYTEGSGWQATTTYYLYMSPNDDGFTRMKRTTTQSDADEWVLIPVNAYFEAINAAYETSDQTSLNVSNLIRDGRFIRNADNSGNHFWYGYVLPGENFDGNYSALDKLDEGTQFYLGMNGEFGANANNDYALYYGMYGAGEIVDGTTGMLRQTIELTTPGTYTVRAKAF